MLVALGPLAARLDLLEGAEGRGDREEGEATRSTGAVLVAAGEELVVVDPVEADGRALLRR